MGFCLLLKSKGWCEFANAETHRPHVISFDQSAAAHPVQSKKSFQNVINSKHWSQTLGLVINHKLVYD